MDIAQILVNLNNPQAPHLIGIWVGDEAMMGHLHFLVGGCLLFCGPTVTAISGFWVPSAIIFHVAMFVHQVVMLHRAAMEAEVAVHEGLFVALHVHSTTYYHTMGQALPRLMWVRSRRSNAMASRPRARG